MIPESCMDTNRRSGHWKEVRKTLLYKTANKRHMCVRQGGGRDSYKIPILRLKNAVCLRLWLIITIKNSLYPTTKKKKKESIFNSNKQQSTLEERQTY